MLDWNKEDFGRRLRELREERGMSMLAFGSAIGTSASRIKDWENGKNAPSAAWIAKISRRFNISTDALIIGETRTNTFLCNNELSKDALYDAFRESFETVHLNDPADPHQQYFDEIDEYNKEKYRSGRGRRRAERELMELVIHLPKKDVLELLEIAKLKKRWM